MASETPVSATGSLAADAASASSKRHPGKWPKNGNQAAKKARTHTGETATRQPRERPDGAAAEPRRPKKKAAVLIGYCGTGYHGMQINYPHKTIEGDLFEALGKAGAISKDNSDDPKKSSFVRAARTDKGVHAAGNVVSAKLIIEDEDLVDKINAHLPEQIRVWGISRTNKAFECRKMASSRMYEYLMPSYCFLPPKPNSILDRAIKDGAAAVGAQLPPDSDGEAFWSALIAEVETGAEQLKAEGKLVPGESVTYGESVYTEPAEPSADPVHDTPLQALTKSIENRHRRAYRIAPERLEQVKKGFKMYEGSHNFHNFTIGKDPKDPSAIRYMKSLDVEGPKLINDTEWLSIKIHGQSFQLHQIRKMVAMVALLVRSRTPLDRINDAFKKDKINIPKAPALGLLLECPVYDTYNSRLNAFGYDKISFKKYKTEVEEFKHKFIYDKIFGDEAKENIFHGFFAFIDAYNGDDIFSYLTLNPRAPTDKKVPSFNDDEDELEGDVEG